MLFKRRNSSSYAKPVLKKGPSPLRAKSVWGAAWLHGQAPAVLRVAVSYLTGFFSGWGARLTLRWTSIAAAAALAVAGLYGRLEGDVAWQAPWIDSKSAWVGENVRWAERYLVSLLPSAAAATIGGVLGFRRK